jgi:hypothetical protein
MKFQLLLATRGGVDLHSADFRTRLEEEATLWQTTLEASMLTTTALVAMSSDPFARANRGMRAYDVVLEGASESDLPTRKVTQALSGVGDRFVDVAHRDLSAVLLGSVNSVVPPRDASTRMLYLMRRRVGTTHAQYIEHYAEVHADIGRRTPEIVGYEQLHVDEEATRSVVEAAGLGVWHVDSVSELHIESVERFVAAVATSPVAAEAPADEERFVDRRNSVMFFCDVLFRSP